VRRGDITWHALPHNAQLELFDAQLLDFATDLTHELDRAFELAPKTTLSLVTSLSGGCCQWLSNGDQASCCACQIGPSASYWFHWCDMGNVWEAALCREAAGKLVKP
jgi:hypothetical protein